MKEETDKKSCKIESYKREKFLSLNKQDAKRVLETYVKRSLSNCETENAKECAKEKRIKKPIKIRRSVSDVSKFRFRVKENSEPVFCKAELEETKKQDGDVPNKPCETQEKDQQDNDPAVTTIAKVPSVKKQTWFKSFLGQLFKKRENLSEQTVRMVSSVDYPTKKPLKRTSRKTSFKKTSMRRTLSLRKNSREEETKLKRPTHLPLKRINTPIELKQWGKNEECFYQQVSVDIEQLVNDADHKRKGSLDSVSNDEEPTKTDDDVIKKIVSILQKEGDTFDRKIKEDPTLNTFLRDISYNSFKQLADVYIDKEVTKKKAAEAEDMKFAYSIHFTKQIAGISSHPVNRIMGFGSQYLEDTFTWLSRSRDNLNTAVEPEDVISPD
ncbi:bcl-2-like protein 12 isoform X2 [Hyperolius riggenbachi]